MGLFRRKKTDDLEHGKYPKLNELGIELKKCPRRDRKKFKELYVQYHEGKVLKTEKE